MSASRFFSWLFLGIGLAAVAAALLAMAFGLAGGGSPWSSKTNRLEWLVDPGKRLTLAEVVARPAEDWQHWDGRTPLQTRDSDALWMRVRLRNPALEPIHGVLEDTEIYVNRVDAWWTRAGQPVGEWPQQASGASFGAGERRWWSWTAAFEISIPAKSEQVVYLRATDDYGVLSWWRWWPRMGDYFSSRILEAIVKSLCLGAMAALLIYNLVLWTRLRFPEMGYYAGYVAAMWVFNFAESGGSAIWGNWLGPAWRLTIEPLSLAVSALFVITFARLFLETAERLPRMDRFLRRLFGVWLAILAGTFTMPLFGWDVWLNVGILGVVVVHLTLLATAILTWIQGFKASRFFVFAFGVLNLGGVTAAAAWGSGGNTHVFVMVLLIASTLEMLLLSLAIADRFAQTQQQLAAETEQRRLLQETYADELALEVNERTRELEAANADKDRMLAVIGHDLRSPLTGLMRSADETVGDFAREASRVGRTVLLLIEDLVLWARMQAGAPAMASHEAQALMLPAVALHRAIAEHEGVRLLVEVPEGLCVRTDLVLTQTLVRNILANALKFARTQVTLRAEPSAAEVRFSVKNDGPPLSAEIAARLTANSDEPVTVTGGLGLRLCREICRKLGIRLLAESGPETEFYFFLPSAAASDHAEEKQ